MASEASNLGAGRLAVPGHVRTGFRERHGRAFAISRLQGFLDCRLDCGEVGLAVASAAVHGACGAMPARAL
jgi:hypothetical protein